MSRHPASIIQADIARVIRASKQAGVCEVSCATDSAVVARIALQRGVRADTLRRALTRNGNGIASRPLGVALDLLAAEDKAAA